MWKNYIELIRVKHWIKNFILVIPAFFGAALFDAKIIVKLIVGFMIFGFVSSAIYIVNDLCDIENDKKHPVKCKRPLASGTVSKTSALIILVLLVIPALVADFLLCGFTVGAFIPIIYFILNLLYSLGLKNKPVIDIVILVSGFFLRTIYGSVITGIRISGWLYLTIMALSLFMVFGKRRNEKMMCGNNTRKVLAHYTENYLNSNMYMYLALFSVFYAIWSLNASNSHVLIYTTPIVLIMVMRYTFTLENDSHGNPVDMILHDPMLIVLGAVYVLLIFLIIYFPEVFNEYLRL